MVAVSSLLYATWRNQTTEHNRNIRAASFEILKNLGELQTLCHYAYYQKDARMGDPIVGWGRVLLIQDLAMVLPPPTPERTNELLNAWEKNFSEIGTNKQSLDAVEGTIHNSRVSVLETLKALQ